MGLRDRVSKKVPRPAAIALALLVAAAAAGQGDEPGGSRVLARVNGEAITLSELLHHLGTLHEGAAEPVAAVEAPDPLALLERVIDVRLVVHEARNIGLDELPGVADQIAAGRRELIKSAVIDERVRGIVAGDSATVERLYREAVREVEVTSVLFAGEEAAREFRMAVEDGADFDFLAAMMMEAGAARGREEAQFLSARDLLPQVARAVSDLEPGAMTPPIDVGSGFTVVKLLTIRLREDPEARAEAEQRALTIRREAALATYSQELRERYAVPDRQLVESLDYDSPTPGIDALRGDSRVLVEIRGGEPITVGDLTERIEGRLFHGIERALERKRANDEILGTLDRLILERAVALEAERLGIEDRPSFRSAARAQEEGLIFGSFVSKVIDPKVEIETDELERFYAEHQTDFSTPEMMRLDGLVFDRREDAAGALARLRRGSDLDWMREHADGQADPEDVAPEWTFAGRLLALSALPDAARAALAGASVGDYRLCEQPDGPFHVLRVAEHFPPRPRDFAEVKQEIAAKLFVRKRQAVFEDWMAALRKASEVEVLVDESGLGELLGVDA